MAGLDDELLSAYIDGELTAAENAQVVQALADDSAARRTVGEFRALRRALQSLPRETLGADFAAETLRAAERATLSEPLEVGPSELRPVGLGRRLLRPRNILWPLLAGAAGLLIAVRHQPNPLAVQDARPPVMARPAEADEPGAMVAAPPPTTPAAEGLLIVETVVSADAVREATLEKILSTQQVRRKAITDDPTGALATIVGKPRDLLPVAAGAPAKTIYVQAEATAAQVEAVLAQLKARPEQFPAVATDSRSPRPADAAAVQHVLFVLRVVRDLPAPKPLPK